MSSSPKKICSKQRKQSCTGRCSWVPKKGCTAGRYSKMTKENAAKTEISLKFKVYHPNMKLSQDAIENLVNLYLYHPDYKHDKSAFYVMLEKVVELVKYAKKKVIHKSDIEFALLFCLQRRLKSGY